MRIARWSGIARRFLPTAVTSAHWMAAAVLLIVLHAAMVRAVAESRSPRGTSQSEPGLSLIGQLGGTSWAVATDGARLFVGAGPRMYVLDATDPASLQVVGRSEVLAGMPVAIVVRDDVAYVATWDYVFNVLYVIDVATPSEPTVTGSVPLQGPIAGMDVSGDYAYVAASGHGLVAVDISDRSSPWRAASLYLPDGAYDVDVVDGYAYVAGGEGGLRVADVRDVGSLRETAHVDTPGDAHSVLVHEGYAYVGDWNVVHGARPSLRVIDARDLGSPVEVGQLELVDDPRGMAVVGEHVYVAGWGAGLVVVDVNDKAHPQKRAGAGTPGMAQGVAVSRGHAFVADDLDGLHVVDLSGADGPRLLRQRPILRITRGVHVAGGYAFVAEGTRFAGGVRMLDIADPTNPVEVAHYDTTGDPGAVPGSIERVHAAGRYVYAVGYTHDGLHVLEVTDEPSLEPVGYLPIEFARSVFADGAYAYVAHQTGFTVVDVADPSRPRAAATLDLQGAYRVHVVDGYAYVSASGGGLHIFDVSTPDDPKPISVIAHTADDAHVVGDTVYLVGSSGLALYDLTDRSAPTFLGRLAMSGSLTSVKVSGDLAYVTRGQSGLAVIDVSDPSAPAELASLDVLEYCYQVDVAGSEIYVAGSRMGLGVLHLLGVPGVEPTASPSPLPTPTVDDAPSPALPMPHHAYLPLAGKALIVGDDKETRTRVGTWTHYVDSNVIRDLAADPARGEVWAASTAGVVAWDIRAGSHHTLTIADGLAGNYVYSVAVDADGDRWFGTWRGLNRLTAEGHWYTYGTEDGLMGNSVLDILVAADGSRWFATDGGVTVLERGDDWGRLQHHFWPAVSMAQDPVTGDIWFAHGSSATGATRLSADGSWSSYAVEDGLALPEVTAVAVDGAGTAWFATVRRHASDSNHLVEAAVFSRSPDGTWVRHAAGDGALAAEWVGGRLDAPFFESLSTPPMDAGIPRSGELVWIGDACQSGSVSVDVRGRVALIAFGGCPNGTKIATAESLGATAAIVMAGKETDDPLISAERPHRMLLEGTFTIPAVMIDAQAGSTLQSVLDGGDTVVVTITSQPGLVDDYVTALTIDHYGTPWFATLGAVGHLKADGTWQSYVGDPFLYDKWVSALAFDADSALWVGTYAGVRKRTADGEWSTDEIGDGLAGNSVRAITFAADGTAWVGSWAGGASRRSPDGQWTAFRRYPSLFWVARRDDHFLGEGFVRAIEVDRRSGITWFGTDSGAVALQPDGDWTRYTTADGLADDWIEDILARDDGSVWFATNRGASVRYPDGTWRTLTPDDGLISMYVRDVAEDRSGGLWFGCSGGASRLAPDGSWRSYTTDDGLIGRDVRQVAIDVEGSVWLGTNMGLSRLPPDGSWQNYPTRQGADALAADPERGGVWYGSGAGLEYMSAGGSHIRITSADGLLDDFVREVAVGPEGRIWCGTLTAGLSVLDPEVR